MIINWGDVGVVDSDDYQLGGMCVVDSDNYQLGGIVDSDDYQFRRYR